MLLYRASWSPWLGIVVFEVKDGISVRQRYEPDHNPYWVWDSDRGLLIRTPLFAFYIFRRQHLFDRSGLWSGIIALWRPKTWKLFYAERDLLYLHEWKWLRPGPLRPKT